MLRIVLLLIAAISGDKPEDVAQLFYSSLKGSAPPPQPKSASELIDEAVSIARKS